MTALSGVLSSSGLPLFVLTLEASCDVDELRLGGSMVVAADNEQQCMNESEVNAHHVRAARTSWSSH